MTEPTLDALRKHAEILHDEAVRFQRSLKGSSANEDQVREHLRNCLNACEAAKAVLDPAKPEPVEVAPEAPSPQPSAASWPPTIEIRQPRKGRK